MYFVPLFTNIKDERLAYPIAERSRASTRGILLGNACIYISTTTRKECKLLKDEVTYYQIVTEWKETWMLHSIYATLLTDGAI